MIRIRYLTILILLLVGSTSLWAQDDSFNPVNPPEPEQPAMRLELRVSPSEAGSASGSGLYSPGKKVNLNTYGNTSFRFVGWTNADGETVSTTKNFEYIKQEGHEVLTANYVFDPDAPADPAEPHTIMYYRLGLSATEGGSVSGGGSYLANSNVTLRANCNNEFEFQGWYDADGNCIFTSSTFNYTTTAKHVMLTGRFVFNPGNPNEPSEPVLSRTVTASATDGGSTNFSSQRLLIGSSVSIYAYNNTGYSFLGWYLNGELYTQLMQFNYTVTSETTQNFEARWEFNPSNPSDPSEPTTTKNSFYLLNKGAWSGATIKFPVYLSSIATLKDMTFQLEFPEELTPDFDGVEMSERAVGYSMSYMKEDSKNYTFSLIGGSVPMGNTVLLTFPIHVGGDVILGLDYPVKINQVTVTDESGNIITASTHNGRISVYLRGDVNGDGVVNGTDIQAVINLIVAGEYDAKADVNNDNIVNGTDIQEVINIIVGGE